jgi:NADPH:quinone reductase-like Zn-dependent oxidoreductase
MKAVFARGYGPPEILRCEEVEDPVPGPGEVLIAVRAAALNMLDRHMTRGTPWFGRLFLGLRRPKDGRVGRDVAGIVEQAGPGVTRFKPGDAVFGACRGALAERACAGEANLAMKPANVSFEQAAGVAVAGLTALQGLRDAGRIAAGQKILVNGASGGIGTFAVQIAKAFGAEVTGVCSAANLDLVRSIGADRAIDYGKEDFTRGGPVYDMIFDIIGNRSYRACRRALAPRGILVAAGAGGPDARGMGRVLIRAVAYRLLSKFTRRKLVMFMTRLKADDLAALAALMAEGKLVPVVGSSYLLAEAGKGMRDVMSGHARGKVVITT